MPEETQDEKTMRAMGRVMSLLALAMVSIQSISEYKAAAAECFIHSAMPGICSLLV